MAAQNGQTNAVGRNNLLDKRKHSVLLIKFVDKGDCSSPLELLVSSAKADLTLQDAAKNTALHLACSKVGVTM